MKKINLFIMVFLALVVSACSTGAENQPQADVTAPGDDTSALTSDAILTVDYDNAASLRNQLALGILALEGNQQAVNTDQAADMLPLWQAMSLLEMDQNAVQEEVEALQTQLIESMTAEQLLAIADMNLTNDDLAAFYAERGIEIGSESGAGQGMQEANKDMTEEERAAFRATRQASEAGDSSGSPGSGRERRSILTDEIIALLEKLISE